MRVLLDTHTILWFASGSEELSNEARGLIVDPENLPLISIVSAWELAIKISIEKIELDYPVKDIFTRQLEENMQLQRISLNAVSVVETLPMHHRDPFDRMLVAQAMTENVPIISRDAAFDAYDVERLW